ncbi:hypothetical protein TNCV_1658311 [Trichonephila clavipes]|nr:hypothetical protein TNCV_1658311 [Trichonephila clavipes]
MEKCKCIVPAWYGCSLNIRRATKLLLSGWWKVKRPDHPQGFYPSELGWSRESNRTVSCMVLKAAVNNSREMARQPWPTEEAFSRPALFLLVFSNS